MQKNRIAFILLVACFSVLNFTEVNSQISKKDSIKNLVDTGPKDTLKVINLNNLSSQVLRGGEIEEALNYAEKARKLATELEYIKGEAYALKNIGMTYYYKGDFLKVLDYWTQSLETFESIEYNLGIANMSNNLGATYYTQGSRTKAIDYYLQSLRISEKIKDSGRIATALINVGGVYSDNPRDYDKALEYYNKIKPYLTNADGMDRIRTAYLIGSGEIYGKQGKPSEAKKFLIDALPLTKGTSEHAYNLTELGQVEFLDGNINTAIAHLNEAYQIASMNEQQLHVVKALLGLGDIYKDSNPKKALEYFYEAENLAKKMQLIPELKEVYEGMSVAFLNSGDYKNAFHFQTQSLIQKDSLFNLKTNDKIRGLQFDFDLEKKQDEIALLEKKAEITELQQKRQKSALITMILTSAIVLLLAIGLYRRYKFISKTNKVINDQKNRAEDLLLNILPYETAKELQLNGKVKAKRSESVTVMFTDFKSFTKHSENLTPEALVKSVDYFFSKFDTIVEKYGLEKIKTIGDSYMCAGGLPFPLEDHAIKVVNAAFEILQVMEDAKQVEDDDISHFDIRIGINTGPVVAGVVGIKKFAYDIWGDTVNIASRMESASTSGRINISSNTYELVKDHFICKYRGEIEVKNRGSLKMYFVNGKKNKSASKALEKSSLEV